MQNKLTKHLRGPPKSFALCHKNPRVKGVS